MRKMKRLITLLMAVVMMMAMSITAFAAEAKTTIKVDGLGKDTTITYTQAIYADRTTATGLNIDDQYVKAFSDVFKGEDGKTLTEDELILAYKNASEKQRNEVIKNIPTSTANDSNIIDITATGVGLYVITPVAAEGEAYIYTKTAIFIDTADLNKENKAVAKKEPTKLDKELVNSQGDVHVEIGADVPYVINTTVPYVLDGNTEVVTKFAINDELTGATYKLGQDQKFAVKVTIGTADAVTFTEDDEELTVSRPENGNESFVLDLSEYVDADNTNANVAVKVEYTVVARQLRINNTVWPLINGHKYDTDDNKKKVPSFSGQITVTKVDGKTLKGLKDAEFVVFKNGTDDKPVYATFENGVITGWTTVKDGVNNNTHIKTSANGTVTVDGFDREVTYFVEEVFAPEGYSLNSKPEKLNWDETVASADVQQATATVKDTQLVTLPFTGGMGTTIFTILGVAIMAMAAALFFATKKNHN